ncbi:YhcN/YlaJ family sporulation lipoprotein [Thermoflavimicrobium daqui]|uniref:YhcN/YlaJ family sporulation lipoprotein n=1 Tax=Thermoflavimicrobium daqui TaxID=2137476 RepID=A0A364K6I3_9BACL|nr:YhcN/YlaJ family sporulation lipoprotein [Thermoflavimicrobium daqui]RAL25903.1 hypothetical protein DL897_07455 [Thermoflavimicrobium daqui]
MRWLLHGFIILSFLCVSVGCAGQTKKGAEDTRPAPTRVVYPTNDIPSKYVNDRDRMRNRAGTVNDRTINNRNGVANDRIINNRANLATPTPVRSYNVRAADQIVHSVTRLPEVRSAAALNMGHNAYVAVTLDKKVRNGRLTDALKQKIANQARKAEPAIRNVYVSANPDFAKQLTGYADDVRSGRPVQGLMDRLTDLIHRTFPESK